MTHANRGMISENIIEISCNQYRERNLAIIQKVPTPVKVLKQYGNKVHGFFEKKGTVDFEGTIRGGKSIAFDSKETKSKTSLSLNNIHKHQLNYMESVSQMGGIAFILVNFTRLDKVYRLDIKDLVGYIKTPYESNLKSVPISFFETYATEVKSRNGLYLDFLKGL